MSLPMSSGLRYDRRPCVGVQLRFVEFFFDESFAVGGDFGVGCVGECVRSYKSRSGEEFGFTQDVLLFRVLQEEAEAALDGVYWYGFGEAVDDGDFVAAWFCLAAFALGGQSLGNCMHADGDGVRIFERARDGKHQRRGVAEIAIEFDRAGALRKIQRIQLEIHVAEFFF